MERNAVSGCMLDIPRFLRSLSDPTFRSQVGELLSASALQSLQPLKRSDAFRNSGVVGVA